MINRDNYLAIKEYMKYLRDVKQLDELSIPSVWLAGRYLLEFADDRHFYALDKVRPTFPEYLDAQKTKTGKRKNSGILPSTQEKIFSRVRGFLNWAKMYKRGDWRKISDAWIDSLRLRRSSLNASKENTQHAYWKLEDVLTVARYSPETLQEERIKAAVCFLYLSAMRVTAFCSLPADCVNITERSVEQRPSRGVITKNRKAATTFLLPIPEILDVVTAWDEKIRIADAPFWYPFIDVGSHGEWVISRRRVENPRGRIPMLYRSLKELCQKLNLPVLSPHKLRHGHGVYGVQHARNIEELKAVSQNLMHANLGITDGVYGNLNSENIKRVLSTLRPKDIPPAPALLPENLPPEVIQLAQLLLTQMKKGQ